jgi:hypothetical protein
MNRKLRRQLNRNPELRDQLERNPDFTAVATSGGHWKIVHGPTGEFFYASSTSSDRQAIRQVEQHMRRIERGAAS